MWEEGHRADRCPDNKPAPPATPRPAGAKSNKTVSFAKLDFDSAVEEVAKKAAQETVAELAKQGWRHP